MKGEVKKSMHSIFSCSPPRLCPLTNSRWQEDLPCLILSLVALYCLWMSPTFTGWLRWSSLLKRSGHGHPFLREESGYQIRCFFGKIPNGLRPPPSFLENYNAIFLWQIWLHISKEIWWLDSMKCMNRTWCPDIGDNTIVKKTYPEPWNYYFVSI